MENKNGNYTKDPDATLDYTIDWSEWLAEADNDTISASEWLTDNIDGGIEITSDSKTDTTATVWLAGGTIGERYKVTNRITTVGSRIDDRSIKISVMEK